MELFIMELTQAYVKNRFNYKNGKLYWKIQPPRKKPCIGMVVGCLKRDKSGDRYVTKVFNKMEYISRIVFLWHKGYLPEYVDHENRNMLDDRIENLREADSTKNARNRTSAKGSSSKYLGVSLIKSNNKWRATIGVNRKNKIVGVFINENQAALAYNEAASILFGEFANLNVIT